MSGYDEMPRLRFLSGTKYGCQGQTGIFEGIPVDHLCKQLIVVSY